MLRGIISTSCFHIVVKIAVIQWADPFVLTSRYKKNADVGYCYDEKIAHYQVEHGIDPNSKSKVKRQNGGLGARNRKLREAEEKTEKKAERTRARKTTRTTPSIGKRSRDLSTSAEAGPSTKKVKPDVKEEDEVEGMT
jgi:hypothetical protein